MSRKNTLWLGTNLKMFKTPRQTEEYLRALREVYRSLPWREELSLFVIPSYTALPDAVSAAGDDIMIGAQNMHWEEQGEFTGEISPLMLEEIGVRLVMTAHSERRRKFGETDETANKKVLSSVRHGFVSLLCVGEDAEQKASGTGLAVMRRQLEVGLSGLSDCGLSGSHTSRHGLSALPVLLHGRSMLRRYIVFCGTFCWICSVPQDRRCPSFTGAARTHRTRKG